MRYVEARLEEYQRDQAYRSYVARSLQLIPQNKHIVPTFEEILHPAAREPEKTGDEIVEDIMQRAGLHFEV